MFVGSFGWGGRFAQPLFATNEKNVSLLAESKDTQTQAPPPPVDLTSPDPEK